MEGCLFCKIANGEIKSTVLYEDENVLAFRDIDPQAPEHFLVIPKRHIESVDHLSAEDADVLVALFSTIKKVAAQLKISGGYRVVSNVGEDGGQSVPHLHFHVLGGRSLSWPPG